jgi:hypothetical protein
MKSVVTMLKVKYLHNISDELTTASEEYSTPNGVHGWIPINTESIDKDTVPNIELLFIDGRIAASLIDDLAIPKFQRFLYITQIMKCIVNVTFVCDYLYLLHISI